MFSVQCSVFNVGRNAGVDLSTKGELGEHLITLNIHGLMDDSMFHQLQGLRCQECQDARMLARILGC